MRSVNCKWRRMPKVASRAHPEIRWLCEGVQGRRRLAPSRGTPSECGFKCREGIHSASGKRFSFSHLETFVGGESGIRTHGRVSPTHAFQACLIDRSSISPFRINDLRSRNRPESVDCDTSSNVRRSLTAISSIPAADTRRRGATPWNAEGALLGNTETGAEYAPGDRGAVSPQVC